MQSRALWLGWRMHCPYAILFDEHTEYIGGKDFSASYETISVSSPIPRGRDMASCEEPQTEESTQAQLKCIATICPKTGGNMAQHSSLLYITSPLYHSRSFTCEGQERYCYRHAYTRTGAQAQYRGAGLVCSLVRRFKPTGSDNVRSTPLSPLGTLKYGTSDQR